MSDYYSLPPSLITGVARTLDLGATFDDICEPEESPETADYNALSNDWRAVGGDIASAIRRFGREVLGGEEEHSKGGKTLIRILRNKIDPVLTTGSNP